MGIIPSMSISTHDCARCHRPVPDLLSDDFLSWQALGESGEQLICPGCLTPDRGRAVAGEGDATGMAKEAVGQSHEADLRDKVTADLKDKVAVLVSDMVTVLASDLVAELEKLGGISTARVEAITGGEDPTNGELEELGYVFVELMRALKDE